MTMKRIRIEDSETESASDDGSGSEGKQGKDMPIYEIVPTEDNDSLVRTFRRVREPDSSQMHSPDSTQDGDDPNQRKIVMIPPTQSSSSSSSSSSESEEDEDSVRSPTSNSLTTDTSRQHKANCPYRRLSEAKNNLLTDGEVKSALTSSYMNKYMRNGSGLSLGKAMVTAADRSNNALASGPIRDYLDSQRRMASDSSNWGLGLCKCPLAERLQDGVITSSGSSPQASTSNGTSGDDSSPGCSYSSVSGAPRDGLVSTSGSGTNASATPSEENNESPESTFSPDYYDSDSDD